MSPQEVIKVLFDRISNDPLLDPSNSKIFLPTHFSKILEEEMGIKNIKSSGLGLYLVEYGPWENISCFNKEENYSVKFYINGNEIID